MRKRTWLITTLLLAAAAAGCSDSTRSAGKQLAEQVDLARRLYRRASTLLADPTYVDKVTGLSYATAETVLLTDGSKYVGVVTQTKDGYEIKDRAGLVHKTPAEKVKAITAYKLPDNEIAMPSPPATGPAAVATKADGGREALELLDKARKLLVEATQTNPQASPAIRADAQLLLGQIELAAGQYHAVRAERTRSQAARMRRASARLLESARDSAALGEFKRALANAPDQKIVQLRDQADIEVQALSTKVAATGDEIDKLRKEITELAKDNTQLRDKATDLRDRSEKAGGQESYQLLTQAHTFKRPDPRQQQPSVRRTGSHRTTERRRAFPGRSTGGRQGKAPDSERQAAEDENPQCRSHRRNGTNPGRERKETLPGRYRCRRSGQPVQAADDPREAGRGSDGQGRASPGPGPEQHPRTTRGRPEDPAKTAGHQRDPRRFRRRQAPGVHRGPEGVGQPGRRKRVGGPAQHCQEQHGLADELASVAAKLKQPVPPVAAELRGYLPDKDATKQRAIDGYLAAEKDLEAILDTQLKTGIGKNIRWIYQARLAGAYYGHFRLTGDAEVLLKAQNFVNDALAGKEGSPYLVTVMNLKALLDQAQPVGQP